VLDTPKITYFLDRAGTMRLLLKTSGALTGEQTRRIIFQGQAQYTITGEKNRF